MSCSAAWIRARALSSARTGKPVRIDDLASDQRWRQYGVRALAHGVRSALSAPLITCDRPVGALNLYFTQAGFFGEAEPRLAEQFATGASVAVGLAGRLAEQAVLTGQLRASLASRAVIDQALGVIMAHQRRTATEAFGILRTASWHRNLKARYVAGQVVTGIAGSPPQPPPFCPSWLIPAVAGDLAAWLPAGLIGRNRPDV